MKDSFRSSMAWLHGWSGLLVGWLLFAIFLTGTASYYRGEITQWMRPEIRPQAVSPAAAAARAVERLRVIAPDAQQWLIDLPTAREPTMWVLFRYGGNRQPSFGEERLDPSTGAPIEARRSRGGDSLYFFHFDLLMPSIWGRLIVVFAAVTMLVSIVSGVVTHRRIFRSLFAFRPGQGPRSWRDAHTLLGTIALPYHLLITYTGTVTLLLLYMPWGIDLVYDGKAGAFLEDLGAQPNVPTPAGRRAPPIGMESAVATAAAVWNGGRPGRITIHHPDDGHARIALYRAESETVSHRPQWVLLDGTTGALLKVGRPAGVAARTHAALYGLHLARFAEPGLRWALFLCGLAGTATIAAGLQLWVAKRSGAARPRSGTAFVAKLNIAAIAGLPAGIAGLFLANRLLPLDLPGRADWEVRCLCVVWLAVALWVAIRPTRRAWIEALGLCAALFAAVPVVNALTTARGLVASIATRDWVFAGFDLTMLGLGLGFACVAWNVRRRATAAPTPSPHPSPPAPRRGRGGASPCRRR